jgi:hypothetical protein
MARLVKRLRATTTRKAKQGVSLLFNDIKGEDPRARTMVDRTSIVSLVIAVVIACDTVEERARKARKKQTRKKRASP